MTSVDLTTRFIFGVGDNVNCNLAYTDDENCVFINGFCVLIFNKFTKRLNIIQDIEVLNPICCLSSGHGQRIIAIAESGDLPKVHLIDLKTQKIKKSINSDVFGNCCRAISLSDDEKTLTVLSSMDEQGNQCLSMWQWAKSKMLSCITVSTNISKTGNAFVRMSVGGRKNNLICITGKHLVHFYEVVDSNFQFLNQFEDKSDTILSVCWLQTVDAIAVAGTTKGDVLLFENYRMRNRLSTGNGKTLTSLISFSNLLVCGASDATISFFDFSGSLPVLLAMICNSELSSGKIENMTINPSKTTLGAATSDGQLLSIPLTEKWADMTSESITPLLSPFHRRGQAIIAVDICSTKPLFVSCSKDNQMCFWNYHHHSHRLLFSKTFDEEVFGLALHPSGMQIAVSFFDKVRIYYILADGLRACLELSVKSCRECRFSAGGSRLALAHGSSIAIVDVTKGHRLADLRGHNGRVRGLQWLYADSQLLSCGQEGAVYRWDVESGKRLLEHTNKGVAYSSVATAADIGPVSTAQVGGDSSEEVESEHPVLVSGCGGTLVELQASDLIVRNKWSTSYLSIGQVLIARSKGLVITAAVSSSGTSRILVNTYPSLRPDFGDFICSPSPIANMSLSSDEQFLIVGTETEGLLLYEVHNTDSPNKRKLLTIVPEPTVSARWVDTVLVTASDLEMRQQQLDDKRRKIQELVLSHDYQLKLREMAHSEKVKKIIDDQTKKVEEITSLLKQVQREREECVISGEATLKEMFELGDTTMHEGESLRHKEVMRVAETVRALQNKRDALEISVAEKRKKVLRDHERRETKTCSTYEQRLHDEEQSNAVLRSEIQEHFTIAGETIEQMEEEVDNAVETLKSQFNDKIESCRSIALRHRGDIGLMSKKNVALQSEIEDSIEEEKKFDEIDRKLLDQIKLLEREIAFLRNEVQQREKVIEGMESTITDHKKKNQELEKFKFVLDFKIKELRQQIEPREKEIEVMKQQIQSTDNQLDLCHKQNCAMDAQIGELRTQVDAVQQLVKAASLRRGKLEIASSRFQSDVQLMIDLMHSPAELKQAVQQALEKHGYKGEIPARIEPHVAGEFIRQKSFLHASLKQLKVVCEEKARARANLNSTRLKENMSLLCQVQKQKALNSEVKQWVQEKLSKFRQNVQKPDSKISTRRIRNKVENQISSPDTDSRSDSGGSQDRDEDERNPVVLVARRLERIRALETAVSDLEAMVSPTENSYELHQYSKVQTDSPGLSGSSDIIFPSLSVNDLKRKSDGVIDYTHGLRATDTGQLNDLFLPPIQI